MSVLGSGTNHWTLWQKWSTAGALMATAALCGTSPSCTWRERQRLVNPNGPPWLAVEVIPWDVKPRTQDAIVTTRIIRILLGPYFTVFIWRLLGSISSNFTSRDQWWIPFHPKVENFWRTDVISKYLDKVSSPKKKWEDESTTGHGTFHLSTFQYLLSSISCNTIGFL